MGATFRQSMAWLHTWTGLTVGWVLYFIFLTGTVGYLNNEVDRWMRPEAPLVVALPAAPEIIKHAQTYLQAMAPDSAQWIIQMPGDRYTNDLNVGWLAPASDGRGRGQFVWQILDAKTGAPISYEARETGGGLALYWMHFALYHMSRQTAALIVGVCTMFMLVALLTGVVIHRRIFTDFFIFRPAKGQRSWLDAHNVLSVTALPFHLMITWSGLLFFMYTYMPLGLTTLYPDRDARVRFSEEALTLARATPMIRDMRLPADTGAPLAPLDRIVSDAEALWGKDEVASVEAVLPNHGGRLTVRARRALGMISRDSPALRFDPATGQSLGPVVGTTYTEPGAFHTMLIGLHKANFARPWLRALFVFAGLASTAMIGTGLVLWSAKRKTRIAEGAKPPIMMVVIDALNVGTIIGLPIAIAAYFWANRLLPLQMENRAAWEMNTLFITWVLTFLYAALRPYKRVWIEMPLLAALVYAFTPILNAFTTDRHLGVTLPAGDWVLAGFDISMAILGVGFAALAWICYRTRQRHISRVESTAHVSALGAA